MSYADLPEKTDAEKILIALDNIHNEVAQNASRLDSHADAINAMGANVQWLVENVQQIFATFANPAFMSQMMTQMTSMIGANGDAGQHAAAPGGD